MPPHFQVAAHFVSKCLHCRLGHLGAAVVCPVPGCQVSHSSVPCPLRLQIINKDNVQEAARETDGYFIKSGIVTVIKDALIPAGTII